MDRSEVVYEWYFSGIPAFGRLRPDFGSGLARSEIRFGGRGNVGFTILQHHRNGTRRTAQET